MADITIEAAALTTAQIAANRGGTFWTTPLIGYVIYLDTSANLVYRKTINGGSNWSAANTIIPAIVQSYDCWADWQTAGDAGTKIHIAAIETATDTVMYAYLDTSNDSEYTDTVEAAQGTGAIYALVISRATFHVSITKTRGGNLAVAFRYRDTNASETFFYGFYTSPDGDTWTSKTSPWETASDYIILLPANLADNQDLWGLFWDISANAISIKTFDNSGNSWSETSVASSMTESAGYLQMDGAIRLSDGYLLGAAWSQYDNADSDLTSFIYDGTNVTAKTNILTNTAEYFLVSCFINQNTNRWYVAYVGGSAAQSLVIARYQYSDDSGATWNGDTAFGVDAEDDYRWISCGAAKKEWGGKFQPVWFDDDDDDIFTNVTNGITIAVARSLTGIIGYLNTSGLDANNAHGKELLDWINWAKCDVVILAAFSPVSDSDPTLTYSTTPNDWFGGFDADPDTDTVAHIRAASPGTVILISLSGTTDLTALMHDADDRAALVTNIVAKMTTYDVDGVEIDWEDWDANHQTDMGLFIDALYDEIHASGKKIGMFSSPDKTKFECTTTVFAKVDYLMTSSYYGDADYVKDFIDAWVTAGYTKSKIYAGMAMEGFDDDNWQGACWWDDIVDNLTPLDSENGRVLGVGYDVISAYMYPPHYDLVSDTLNWQGIDLVREVTGYAKANGFGGVGFWSLDQDYMTSATLDAHSILKTAYDTDGLLIQPTVKDGWIAMGDADANNYGYEFLRLYAEASNVIRSLMEFNLSDVPEGVTIFSVELSLYYYAYEDADPVSRTVTLYRLRRADWVENETTWNIYKTGSNWGTAGAANTTSDIDTALTASQTMPAAYGWVNFDILDLAEDAIANRSDLLELRMHDASAADWIGIRFYNRLYTTDATKQPKLTIIYITHTPGGWANIKNIRAGTGTILATDLSHIWFGTTEVAVADIAEIPVGVAV